MSRYNCKICTEVNIVCTCIKCNSYVCYSCHSLNATYKTIGCSTCKIISCPNHNTASCNYSNECSMCFQLDELRIWHAIKTQSHIIDEA